MLVQNTFDNLMDSSLGVRYGVADIQGNTFEKLTGKPFVDMRPMIETVSIALSFYIFKKIKTYLDQDQSYWSNPNSFRPKTAFHY